MCTFLQHLHSLGSIKFLATIIDTICNQTWHTLVNISVPIMLLGVLMAHIYQCPRFVPATFRSLVTCSSNHLPIELSECHTARKTTIPFSCSVFLLWVPHLIAISVPTLSATPYCNQCSYLECHTLLQPVFLPWVPHPIATSVPTLSATPYCNQCSHLEYHTSLLQVSPLWVPHLIATSVPTLSATPHCYQCSHRVPHVIATSVPTECHTSLLPVFLQSATPHCYQCFHFECHTSLLPVFPQSATPHCYQCSYLECHTSLLLIIILLAILVHH